MYEVDKKDIEIVLDDALEDGEKITAGYVALIVEDDEENMAMEMYPLYESNLGHTFVISDWVRKSAAENGNIDTEEWGSFDYR